MTRRVHCKKERFDIYAGRPTAQQLTNGELWRFGNPFVIGLDGDRSTVINKFKNWLTTGEACGNINATEERRQWILNNLYLLVGNVIGCWCGPGQDCHVDYLIELAEKV